MQINSIIFVGIRVYLKLKKHLFGLQKMGYFS